MALPLPSISLTQLQTVDGRNALDAACESFGIFRLEDHSIPQPVLGDLLHNAREFFQLPITTKRRVVRTAANPWGYYDQELTKNKRDRKEIYDYGPALDTGLEAPWPDTPEQFKTSVLAYYQACEQLAHQLLAAMANNLSTSATELAQQFHPEHSSFVRINYFPETSANTEAGLGIHNHTDSGALTILLHDAQAGLEILHQGQWQQVSAPTNSILVNLGDIAQVWSNDRYQAVEHRVQTAGAERYSAPFFFNPAYSVNYAPLKSALGDNEQPRYRSINWGEFRRLRTAGDYADVGTEVQISAYANNN